LTHKKEQQIKIEGEFKPTVDCLCATRRRFVFIHKGIPFKDKFDTSLKLYGLMTTKPNEIAKYREKKDA